MKELSNSDTVVLMSYEIRTTGDKEKTMKLFFDVSVAKNTSNYYNVFLVIMFSLPVYALH